MDKDILLYKIYIKAKQKHLPLYKIQHFLEDICEELHIDLIGPITFNKWNRHKYFLTIIDGYSRYQ